MTIDRTPYFVRVEQGNAGAEVSRMEMVEVQVSDLHGTALNLAVAQAEGRKVCLIRGGAYGAPNSLWYVADLLDGRKYDPAGNWAVGGPLLDKYDVELMRFGEQAFYERDPQWNQKPCIGAVIRRAPGCTYNEIHIEECNEGGTRLIAGCRAIVCARLGKAVMVPAELVEVAA